VFKNVHPASSSASATRGGAFKRLTGGVFSTCVPGTIQGTPVLICSFTLAFSVGGIALPYRLLVAGLGGAVIGASAAIVVKPTISDVHVFPSLAPQLFDNRVQQSTLQVSQTHSSPSLPFISVASSYAPMRNKHAVWSLVHTPTPNINTTFPFQTPSLPQLQPSGAAVGILRSLSTASGDGGGIELQEIQLTSLPAAALTDVTRLDFTLCATVDGVAASLPMAVAAVSASAVSIQAVMQQCGIVKAGWVSVVTSIDAEVAVAAAVAGPLAMLLDFQGNALPNVRVCAVVGDFSNSTVVGCSSSNTSGLVQLPPFLLPPVRFLVGALLPWCVQLRACRSEALWHYCCDCTGASRSIVYITLCIQHFVCVTPLP